MTRAAFGGTKCPAQLRSPRPSPSGHHYLVACRLAAGHAGSHHDWAGSSGIKWTDAGEVELRGQFTRIPEWAPLPIDYES